MSKQTEFTADEIRNFLVCYPRNMARSAAAVTYTLANMVNEYEIRSKDIRGIHRRIFESTGKYRHNTYENSIRKLENLNAAERVDPDNYVGKFTLDDNAYSKLLNDGYTKKELKTYQDIVDFMGPHEKLGLTKPKVEEKQMDVQSAIKTFAETLVAEKEKQHVKELAERDQEIERLNIKCEDVQHDNDDLTIQVEELTSRLEELEADNAELAQALRVIRNYDAKYAKE